MKRRLSLLLVVALLVVPFHAFAQDEPEMVEYTSADELLTLSYPADWLFAETDEEIPFPNFSALNSEEAMARWAADEDPISGDALIMEVIFPVDFVTLLGLELPEEPTVVDYAGALAAFFSEPDSSSDTDPDSVQVAEPEEIDLGDGLMAGIVASEDDISSGAYIVRVLDEDGTLLSVTWVAAYVGEYTDELAALGQAVASTVAYTGSADDVMDAIMGISSTSPDASMDAGLDGATLVATVCTACHSADRIDNADKDEAGWTATVDRMISNGAQLDDAQRQIVIDYLVETH